MTPCCVSEKLWKPILNGHPFVVAGTPGTLAYLRSLGFRTFTPIIDERYDTLADDAQRMQAILDTIDALGALNEDERAVMLERMQPILAHNASHLRQLKSPMAKVLSDIDDKFPEADRRFANDPMLMDPLSKQSTQGPGKIVHASPGGGRSARRSYCPQRICADAPVSISSSTRCNAGRQSGCLIPNTWAIRPQSSTEFKGRRAGRG